MLTSNGLGLALNTFWMAQLGTPTPTDQSAVLFTGPKFFVALIAGIILAFGFQLLLTNLSVAAGISYLGHQDSGKKRRQNHRQDHPDQEREATIIGGTLRKISFAVGLWTLITVSLALFLACFLAIKLSLLFSPGLGAILGVVIWAAYFSLLVWLSSSRISSALGSVAQSAIAGFQSLLNTAMAAMSSATGTATYLLGRKAVDDRIVATAGAAAAAVRREFTAGLDPKGVRETLEDYLENLRPPQLDTQKVRNQFVSLLRSPEVQSLVGSEPAKKIGRHTFIDLVRHRSDLSEQEVSRLADQLHHTWQQFVNKPDSQLKDPIAEVRDYLSTALPQQLRSRDLGRKLERLLSLMESQAPTQAKGTSFNGTQGNGAQGNGTQGKGAQGNNLRDQALQMGMAMLMSAVLGRKDLSELDVDQVLGQLRQWRDKITQSGQQLGHQLQGGPSQVATPNTIRNDIENYLLNTYSWQMRSDLIERDFREVLYDPKADPTAVRQQLETLSRNDFEQLLSQRGVFTQEEIAAIADQLESLRGNVLAEVTAAAEQEQSLELYSRLDYYLRTTAQPELGLESSQRFYLSLLDEGDRSEATLQAFLTNLDRPALDRMLIQRSDLNLAEREQLITDLLAGRDRTLEELHIRQTQRESQLQALRERIETYLRQTNREELNPEGIERDLQTLLSDPQLGVAALRTRLSQFDRDTLVQLLSQRQDLTEEQVNQIIDQFQSTWSRIVHAPQTVSAQAKAQVEQVTTSLADYLRNTHLEELDPEGIQRDLALLFNDPITGVSALQRRLAQVDRETLVKLLSQRPDVSEEQVSRTIDQVLLALQQFARVPRRLAVRTQSTVVDFQTSLANYLRNTRKDELNPEGIQHDIQLLLHDPRAGWEQFSDRLAHFDRSTLVALLAQRPDMTEAEANQVIDQVDSVRLRVMEQSQNLQRRLQTLIDSILEQVRTYLNSLERPELNYEGIQRDLRTLFSDRQAGFEALRVRLSQFNQDTLMAILHARSDMPKNYIHRIVEQVETARTSVLQRAERLQQSTQRQLEELQQQAQKEMEETRKAAESAAWWLFGTAIVSAGLSALAGAIAVMVP